MYTAAMLAMTVFSFSLQQHCDFRLVVLKYSVSGVVFSSWKQLENCWYYVFQVSASSILRNLQMM